MFKYDWLCKEMLTIVSVSPSKDIQDIQTFKFGLPTFARETIASCKIEFGFGLKNSCCSK
jgi:hypothetical protein